MAFRHGRVFKERILRHAKAAHDRLRAYIAHGGKRDNAFFLQHIKGKVQTDAGSFGAPPAREGVMKSSPLYSCFAAPALYTLAVCAAQAFRRIQD